SNAPFGQENWERLTSSARNLEPGSAWPVQAMAALHAEAVASQVVVPARRANEPARWIRLQPSLGLAAIPDAILGSQHPAPALAVEHREVAHRDAVRARLQVADAALLDQELVSDL